MAQETKLYKKGTIQIENFCVFEKLRETNQGGGLMTVIHEHFQPALISNRNSSKMSENVLVFADMSTKGICTLRNDYEISNCFRKIKKRLRNLKLLS